MNANTVFIEAIINSNEFHVENPYLIYLRKKFKNLKLGMSHESYLLS